jgi:hypothetical protein
MLLPTLHIDLKNSTIIRLSSMATVASKAAQSVGKAAGKAAQGSGRDTVLKKGARRDPELYVRQGAESQKWHGS